MAKTSVNRDKAAMWAALKQQQRTISANKIVFTRSDKGGRTVAVDCCYEAFVFALVCEAAEKAGMKIDYVTHGGVFRFRGGHGKLHTTNKVFSYAVIEHKGKKHELHLDTFVATRVPRTKKEKIEIEVDVLVISESAARLARKDKAKQIGCGSLRLAIEVKYRARDDGISVVMAKEVLGQWSLIGSASCNGSLIANHKARPHAEALLKGAGLAAHGKVLPQKGYAKERRRCVDALSTALKGKL